MSASAISFAVEYDHESRPVLSASHIHKVSVTSKELQVGEVVKISLCFESLKLVPSRLRPTASSEPICGHDVVNGVPVNDDQTAIFQVKINSLSSQHDNANFRFRATCGDVSFSSSPFRVVSKTTRKRKAASEESDASSNCNTDDIHSVELDKEELVDALDFLEDLRDTTSPLSIPLCDCAKNECAMHLVNQSLLSVKSSLARIEALLTNRT